MVTTVTLLAPTIVEAILKGRQPKGVRREDLARGMLTAWEEQRKVIYPLPL
jgi:hypothetical protein